MTESIRIDGYEISIPAGPSEDYVVLLKSGVRGSFARLLFKAGASRADVEFDGERYSVVFDIRRYHDIIALLDSGKPTFLHIDDRGAAVHAVSSIEDDRGWPATFD